MAIVEQSYYYKQIEAERAAARERARRRRIDPDRIPREVLQQLTPDWRQYETVPFEEARSLEASDTVRLFLEEGGRWTTVPRLRRREPGQKALAFRRRPPEATGGAGRRPRQPKEALPVMSGTEVYLEPSVSISRPTGDGPLRIGDRRHFGRHVVLHPVREGDTPAAIARRVTGQAEPRRLLGYADGGLIRKDGPMRINAQVRVNAGPALKVGGGASNTDSVRFTWDGPTRGAETVPAIDGGWDFAFPVQPGTYTLTVSAGASRHSRTVDVVGEVEIAEIAYLPATGTLLALTADEAAELEAAAQPLDKAILELREAREGGDADTIGQAADRLQQALRQANGGEPLAAGGSSADITEVVRFKGRKHTLVPKGKVRRHWRRYRLDAEMRNRSRAGDLLGSDGRLSTEKLLNRMKKQIREQSGFEATFLESDQYQGALTDWAAAYNSQPEVMLFENTDENGNTILQAGVDAALLRYSAGASLSADFKPAEGRFGLHGEAKAELALAEGRLRAAGYFPHDKGHPVRVELPMNDGSRKEIDLGAMRAKLDMALYGFAGASAALSADIEMSVSEGKVLLKAVTNPRELRERDMRFTPVSASASAFAGVRAGCKVDGALEWDNLQKRPADADPAWRPLAGVGADANFSIGAGAEGEFTISYDRGKFYIRAKAAAVLGLGCGGDLAFTVHADNIAELVMFVYHRLKDEDFDKLQFIQEFAFEVLYQLVLFEIWTGKKIAQQYVEGYNSLSNWWKTLVDELYEEENQRKAAESLARRINSRPELLLFTTPEAKGHMLRVLCQTSILSFEEEQEEAIITILETLQSRRDYMETLEHMTFGAEKIAVAEGERILRGILDGQEHYTWQRLRNRLMELPDALPARAPVHVAVSFPASDTRTV